MRYPLPQNRSLVGQAAVEMMAGCLHTQCKAAPTCPPLTRSTHLWGAAPWARGLAGVPTGGDLGVLREHGRW